VLVFSRLQRRYRNREICERLDVTLASKQMAAPLFALDGDGNGERNGGVETRLIKSYLSFR